MDERKRRILQAIIQDYIKSAEPVGSRTIARNYDLGISPATVRNEMYDLEQLGFLEQPHTSAGRIPSSKGYRYYVDSMMSNDLDREDTHRINALWQEQNRNSSEFFLSVAKLISQISHNMSLFLAPAHDSSMLKFIHVLPFDGQKAIMVVITDTGALDNELMHFDESVDQDMLQSSAIKFSNAIKDRFLRDITRDSLAVLIAGMEGPRKVLIVLGETLYRAISKRKLFYSVGTTELLQQPEFNSVEKVQPILSLVEEQDQLSKILADKEEQQTLASVKIKIGTENEAESLRDVSLIQADFSSPKEHVGTLAVLGPTRMEYSRIIGMLTYMQKLMDTMVKNQEDTKR